MTPREALESLGLHYVEGGTHHHVRPGWIGLDCPACSPNTGRIRLGLNLTGVYLSCWTCGKLPLHGTLAEASGMPVRDVASLFRGVHRISAPDKQRVRGKLSLPEGLGELLPPHVKYLKERNFDPDHLSQLWGIQGIGARTEPGMAWRIFIPIRKGEETVSWTARAITDNDSARRYHNARPDQEALPAKSLLYGAEHVRHGVIVHEGPTDVWRTGVGAVATMGLAYSRSQVLLLSEFPVRVIVFDSEPEAQKRAGKLCDQLAGFPGTTRRVELDSPDPGSANDREIKLLRRMIR